MFASCENFSFQGLEIYCDNNSQVTHLYLSFKSKAERDALYHGLLDQPFVRLENTEQEVMTLQWQNGVLSNYDYLLYINRYGTYFFCPIYFSAP
jgi:factor associated with neutral sphingomyelinase activation